MTGSRLVQAVKGPLAAYAAGFESELTGRGYSSSTVRLRLWMLNHLSRWLEEEHLAPSELTPERATQFLEMRRAKGYKTWLSAHSLALPLEYLCSCGVVPEPATRARSQIDDLLDAYHQYLVNERGLAEVTVEYYEGAASLFLSMQPNGPDLAGLGPADVTAFVTRECAVRSVSGAKYMVAALRSWLRYLHMMGLTGAPLAQAVPAVAGGRRTSLPRGLESAHVALLLASCNQDHVVGRRDYAILIFLARLGLRAGEVAALTLDDVDWHRGEIMIRGKGRRLEPMPLPRDVGEALVAHLRDGRPRGEDRNLFLRVNAPRGPLRPSAVRAVVHDACVRAGLPPVGAHRLRHTVATEMLRAGGSLAEIAQVLRHRHLDTTAVYAKVDHRQLITLAQPWPGGAA
jgi:integrase/recombinase XerD